MFPASSWPSLLPPVKSALEGLGSASLVERCRFPINPWQSSNPASASDASSHARLKSMGLLLLKFVCVVNLEKQKKWPATKYYKLPAAFDYLSKPNCQIDRSSKVTSASSAFNSHKSKVARASRAVHFMMGHIATASYPRLCPSSHKFQKFYRVKCPWLRVTTLSTTAQNHAVFCDSFHD